MQPAAPVRQPRRPVHPAALDPTYMVRIHFDAHGMTALARGDVVAADGAEGFCKDHARAPVQQTVRLVGAVVDRHPPCHPFIADFQHFQTKNIRDVRPLFLDRFVLHVGCKFGQK